jgi:phage baseplate assembly protein W
VIHSPTLEEDIRESMRIILSTAKGERAEQPDFGCELPNLVFQAIDKTTLNRVEKTVREALTSYEPRIEVVKVSAAMDEGIEGKLLINIMYRILSTNYLYEAVYPLCLTEGF